MPIAVANDRWICIIELRDVRLALRHETPTHRASWYSWPLSLEHSCRLVWYVLYALVAFDAAGGEWLRVDVDRRTVGWSVLPIEADAGGNMARIGASWWMTLANANAVSNGLAAFGWTAAQSNTIIQVVDIQVMVRGQLAVWLLLVPSRLQEGRVLVEFTDVESSRHRIALMLVDEAALIVAQVYLAAWRLPDQRCTSHSGSNTSSELHWTLQVRAVRPLRLIFHEAGVALAIEVVVLHHRKRYIRGIVRETWRVLLADRVARRVHDQRRQVLHVILHQIIKDLLRAEVVFSEGPIHDTDHLLALVAQRLLHFVEELTL